MKAQIVYLQEVTEEIEIPNELVELTEKGFFNRNFDEDNALADGIEDIWRPYDRFIHERIGIYYGDHFYDTLIEY